MQSKEASWRIWHWNNSQDKEKLLREARVSDSKKCSRESHHAQKERAWVLEQGRNEFLPPSSSCVKWNNIYIFWISLLSSKIWRKWQPVHKVSLLSSTPKLSGMLWLSNTPNSYQLVSHIYFLILNTLTAFLCFFLFFYSYHYSFHWLFPINLAMTETEIFSHTSILPSFLKKKKTLITLAPKWVMYPRPSLPQSQYSLKT